MSKLIYKVYATLEQTAYWMMGNVWILKECTLFAHDMLFSYKQVDQQSLCNIEANDIFDDVQSLDFSKCSLFAHDTLFGIEQIDQQSVHDITNVSVTEGELPKIVLFFSSCTHAKPLFWQVN
jgi:hypothetical protein